MNLTFMCDPTERAMPMNERTMLWVCDGPRKIGLISADRDESADRNHTLAVWKARVLHENFDPFLHEHEPDKEGKHPHVESDNDGFTSLVHPKAMSLSEARQWVRDNYVKLRKK